MVRKKGFGREAVGDSEAMFVTCGILDRRLIIWKTGQTNSWCSTIQDITRAL